MAGNTSSTLTVERISDLQVRMTRTFDAPRHLVWEAFTKPEHVSRWWGPRYLTTVVEELDVRPGGSWRFIQREPDGTQYAFYGVFREVVPPTRLVQTFEFEGAPGQVMVDDMTLEEHDGKTTITIISTASSVEGLEGMIASGMEAGAAESYDRLAELLATMV